MNQELKNRLADIAQSYDERGMEALGRLSKNELDDLESLFNEEITPDLEDDKILTLVQLRYLFRIWNKFGKHIDKGLSLLQDYES